MIARFMEHLVRIWNRVFEGAFMVGLWFEVGIVCRCLMWQLVFGHHMVHPEDQPEVALWRGNSNSNFEDRGSAKGGEAVVADGEKSLG
jgi:hypothetical protein